ncbi:MAG: 16S rRNA (adenine(1518)-N(6)/adenine(1519)-N(6))-dimethyltransferase RsmA, partial [Acidimicrobiia bacterium]
MTLSPADVRALLDRHGLSPSRALGQNFVADPNTVRRIVRLAGVGPGDRVVEIGPGLGSLTLALLDAGAEVTAVEVDRHILPALRETVGARARIVEADARVLDWAMVLGPADPDRPWSLVANLPYNVASGLVLDVLAGAPQVARMLVMVQREVGERLAAGAGAPAYGIPSVKRSWWATATVVARVPPTVFVPQPRVESVLLRVERRPDPAVGDRAAVFALVEAGFGQRRKMLRRALAGRATPDQLVAAGIRPEARAEELDLADWQRLAAVL